MKQEFMLAVGRLDYGKFAAVTLGPCLLIICLRKLWLFWRATNQQLGHTGATGRTGRKSGRKHHD